MKSLRKVLVVVLAVAMLLSVGAVGASAAFTDTTTSNYKEAIDVLSGIGVINGMDSATFDPTGSLTREQGAKIIAYLMLGPTNAALIKDATAQKFSDVAQTRWSAGYIEYCANQNIIVGVGDGKFDPTGKLTTAAFTKMLLVAVGYKADAEGISGTSWAITTASLALTAGVYDSRIAISNLATCTREQAAQLAFKALQAVKVTYTGGTTITIGESTITTGATRSNVTGEVDTIVNDSLMQFAEQHFPGLVKGAAAADDFGRPGVITWTYNLVPIAAALPAATKTYTTTVTAAKIFADLGLTTAGKTATVYVDGKENDTPSVAIAYNDTATTFGGTGATTEVYYNLVTGAIDIVVINQYYGTIGTVNAATAVSKANVKVTPSATKLTGFTGTAAGETFDTTGLVVTTPVIYTVAQKDATTYVLKSVVAATKATLTATSYVANTSFVAGGTTYMYSAKLVGGTAVGDFNAHDVYFDTLGNVIYVTGATTVANYAVVIAAGSTSDGLGGTTYNAKLLMTDGTQKVVVVAADATSPDLRGSIVTYTVSAVTGAYTLVDPTSADYADTLALTKGVSMFTWDGDPFYGNANTVYLVRTGSAPYTYTAYTGVANVPSMSGTATGQVVTNAYGFASVVYVTNATVASSAAGSVYLTGTYSTTVDSLLGTYYTSNAIVDGTPTTVKLAAVPTKGLYTSVSYNAGGIGTIGSAATTTVPTYDGTVAAASGVVGFGNSTDGYEYYSYAADCAVYYISPVTGTLAFTGVGAANSGITSLLLDTNDTVIFTKNLAGQVNAIYVQSVPAT